MHDEHERVDHFLFNCMTQAEQALDGQDSGRMAEALRSILQGAWELHGWRCRQPQSALPQRGVSADHTARADGR